MDNISNTPSECSNTSTILATYGSQLVSGNSFDFTAGASLSDDSGLPQTNSSISSGDSSRTGLCKFEFEIAESDGDVSQFDSLDYSSDVGMGAENFNTLKKAPSALIDPPPEFQDSPNTTLMRSVSIQCYAQKLANNIITNSIGFYYVHMKKQLEQDQTSGINSSADNLLNLAKDRVINCAVHTYNESDTNQSSSCSDCDEFLHGTIKNTGATTNVLTKTEQIDNIYDIPNDAETSDLILTKQIDAKYGTSGCSRNKHERLKNFTPVLNRHRISNFNEYKLARACEIYDYDLYYGRKRAQEGEPLKKTPVLYSPLHSHQGNLSTMNRPNSRNSLNSRLSSSHNSLSLSNPNKADDSIFITQAMSHDALLNREISDFYNVPIDSDIYALPFDVIRPDKHRSSVNRGFRKLRNIKYTNKKRRRSGAPSGSEMERNMLGGGTSKTSLSRTGSKRHSVPCNMRTIEPLKMTLEEVKQFYNSIYSSSSNSSGTTTMCKHKKKSTSNSFSNLFSSNQFSRGGKKLTTRNSKNGFIGERPSQMANNSQTLTSIDNIKHIKKYTNRDKSECNNNHSYNINTINDRKYDSATVKKQHFSSHLKQKFCSIFKFKKSYQSSSLTSANGNTTTDVIKSADHMPDMSKNRTKNGTTEKNPKFSTRALPPLPKAISENDEVFDLKNQPDDSTEDTKDESPNAEEKQLDFAANIEKVRECGWYWGPISSEAAEKILSNEPDGSFVVRDSSDDHYIFSLTFKILNTVRHVRIEQDQGTFSFGSYAKFKSRTIMEFIENAVEHSRSGRYLFFLHRRPEHGLGPMRVQLTNPVSRFKHIQSLQHMCRFVILKAIVRKDLIETLPLPRRILDYLSYKNILSEVVESDSDQSQTNENS